MRISSASSNRSWFTSGGTLLCVCVVAGLATGLAGVGRAEDSSLLPTSRSATTDKSLTGRTAPAARPPTAPDSGGGASLLAGPSLLDKSAGAKPRPDPSGGGLLAGPGAAPAAGGSLLAGPGLLDGAKADAAKPQGGDGGGGLLAGPGLLGDSGGTPPGGGGLLAGPGLLDGGAPGANGASSPLAGPGLLAAPPPPGVARAALEPAHQAAKDEEEIAAKAHAEVLAASQYPSATVCKQCHPLQYQEWAVSPHSYAQLSPAFNAMQATINRGQNGTLGDFCIRCHTPIGMALGEPTFAANQSRNPIALEGITCIVCHRVDRRRGTISARFPVKAGDIFAPIVGPHGPEELERVLADSETYHLLSSPGSGKIGAPVHSQAIEFVEISEPAFCGMCHDVNDMTSFRLESAYSEYKNSPAAGRGVTCQDCHMGKVQGVPSGYAEAPSAIVGTLPTVTRKHANHMMAGPDHSIVHPGLFPHNPDAQKMATLAQWTSFDVGAGWGTDAFENSVAPDAKFPPRWNYAGDRYNARTVIEQNLALTTEYEAKRLEVLRNGYQLGELSVARADDHGLAFDVEVRNVTDGHGTPTGFDAERVTFLQVTVTDQAGQVVFQSGDLDPNGDLRDLHSIYVTRGRVALDHYLFSLQSKFVDRTLRGGEQEQILPTNFSLDPLPFVRPPVQSALVFGTPPAVRKQKRNIEPFGHRFAHYEVNADKLTGKGPYRLNVKLIAGALPINLIYTIQFVGFDYGMSPLEVARRMRGLQSVLWERDVTLSGATRVDLRPQPSGDGER